MRFLICECLKTKHGERAEFAFRRRRHAVTALKLKPAAPATNEEKLAWEKELIGFYLSEHPMANYEDKINAYKAKPIAELMTIKNERLIVRTAGLVSKVRNIFTKSGQPMLFATIEDLAQTRLKLSFSRAFSKRPLPCGTRTMSHRPRQDVGARRPGKDDLRQREKIGSVRAPIFFHKRRRRFLPTGKRASRSRRQAMPIRIDMPRPPRPRRFPEKENLRLQQKLWNTLSEIFRFYAESFVVCHSK